MTTNITTTLCALTLIAALAPTALGAAAPPAKPASVISLTDLNRQLTRLQQDVQTTVQCLNAVKESALDAAALNRSAGQFSQAFETLHTRMETLRTNAVLIKATVNAHYEAWQKELAAVENANLRTKAQTRHTQSRKEFEKIVARANEAKEQAVPFVSQVKDINIYLNADLSAEAVKSLSNDIWKLGTIAKTVNSRLEAVKAQIDRTIQSLPQK